MEGRYWEDFKVGDSFTTQTRTVTETDLVKFVELSGLFEALFLDRESVAKQAIFDKPMVPESLSFVISLGLELLMGLAHGTGIAFLELDEVRALRPVFIDDTIKVDVEVIDMCQTSKSDRGVMTLKYTTENQKGEAVLTYKLTRMVRRRRNAFPPRSP